MFWWEWRFPLTFVSALIVIPYTKTGLTITENIACVANVRRVGERKGKDERVKREKLGRARIAVGDACKDAIVFYIPPSN